MSERILAASAFSHIINAPIGRVDIADWLFHLPSAVYQHCGPPAHIAAGVSTTGDGIPMSINVETIGDWLMIHQIRRRSHRRPPLPHRLNLRYVQPPRADQFARGLGPQR